MARRQRTVVYVCAFFLATLAVFVPMNMQTASAHSFHNQQGQPPSGKGTQSGKHQFATTGCENNPPTEDGMIPCTVASYATPCLNERLAPSLQAAKQGCRVPGSELDIQCQTTGDTVINTNVWDWVQDPQTGGNSYFVSDYYMTTSGYGGSFSPPLVRCINR